MNLGIIIFSRLSSKRLKRKALMKIGNKTLIERVIERLKASNNKFKIIMATSKSEEDRALVEVAKKNKILHFQGELDDVLCRAYSCALKFNLSHVIRVSGDSPLFDPLIIDTLIKKLKSELDILTNTFPRTFPKGFSCEVIRTKTLKQILNMTKNKKDREHVTRFIYSNPQYFRIVNVKSGVKIKNNRNYSIDEEKDLLFIKRLYKKFGEKLFKMNFHEILNLWQK